MPRQLLFYEQAVAVSAARHADLSIETGAGYAFASHASAVPIMAVEFIAAASEYAIVFTAVGEEVVPAVVLGLKPDQNLFVGQDAKWQAKYVPAFIRRYPFVFSTSADRKTLTLCIDESYAGLNRSGKGQPLFDEQRKPSAYTQRVLKFLQNFQAHFERTRLFCQRLKDLGVLEPMAVRVPAAGGEQASVGGFLVASRKKLRELSSDKLAELARSDELELLHLHLHSLRNFADMKDRLIGVLPAEPEESAPTPAPTLQ
jgi:SapC